jgi:UDP-N-acetylglucosamine 2-epimerase (non-hydrolysing)
VVAVGTRPEVIKMAPVVAALAAADRLRPVLLSTGQQADLLTTALADFRLTPDHALGVMTAGQTPAAVAARVLDRLPAVLEQEKPTAVLVQGDTTTALAVGLGAFYAGVPVGHVEAGLRTHDLANPFPEEANRQVLARLARWHFAPTAAAAANLRREGVPDDRTHVTGNTGIDALMGVLRKDEGAGRRQEEGSDRTSSLLLPPSSFVLLTLHRRESFGEPLRQVLAGLLDFLEGEPAATAVWPVHPNPAVQELAAAFAHPRLTRVPPQDYPAFARLLAGCRAVLTDSGGVQEEAPSLGKRVLVARDTTERPEAVLGGRNVLVGRDRRKVFEGLQAAWAEPPYVGPLPAPNPFGDGNAAGRVVAVLREQCSTRS